MNIGCYIEYVTDSISRESLLLYNYTTLGINQYNNFQYGIAFNQLNEKQRTELFAIVQ